MILIMLAALTSACNDEKGPVSFTPEMASFSNEFDFDPLRGPVKVFSQTLLDEEGKVSKRVSGALSKEGCFDSLDLHDVENNTGVSLVLNANYYIDADTQEKRLRLQGKCQLAEYPSAGLTWETDDRGFVTAARGKDVEVTYRYDDEGYPLGKSTTSKDARLFISSTPSTVKGKKMDYTAVSTLNDKPLGKVKQSCDYDKHANPVACELRIVDESVSPAVERKYTIKNTIEYY
ncbi:YnfC family lipoprotein [Metakosakonia massiliensis]